MCINKSFVLFSLIFLCSACGQKKAIFNKYEFELDSTNNSSIKMIGLKRPGVYMCNSGDNQFIFNGILYGEMPTVIRVDGDGKLAYLSTYCGIPLKKYWGDFDFEFSNFFKSSLLHDDAGDFEYEGIKRNVKKFNSIETKYGKYEFRCVNYGSSGNIYEIEWHQIERAVPAQPLTLPKNNPQTPPASQCPSAPGETPKPKK